ncbi:MAG: hypothetical protein RL308_2016 [Bacteroidota bacterium]|jgi:glycosyltransferase involved in cell wall biosynthesis
MVLIDALYVNNGGGKTMLDYLMSKLEEQKIDCFYLLDHRIEGDCCAIKSSNKVVFMKASLWSRYVFYKKNKNKFETIFCLANIPPNIKMNGKTITYFHSTFYIQLSTGNSLRSRIIIAFKKFVLNRFLKNSDYWFVQTEIMKKELQSKFSVKENKIVIKPFYPPTLNRTAGFKKIPFTYLYVSLGTVHKNHIRLIDAFCQFYDRHGKGELLLTLGADWPKLVNLTDEKVKLGYPIKNLGYIKREELLHYYQTSEFLIFPSLTESFGLGLVEGIENECKVIAANLPYTFAVCKPSIVFNPYSVESIVSGLEQTLKTNIEKSETVIIDTVDEIIQLLNQPMYG